MASAYELMLVLRGRNYLSNDLRRAGSDLRRMQSMGGLKNQRSQLGINAQRLASTRSIAQQEITSLTTGKQAKALDKARLSFKDAEFKATQKLNAVNKEVLANQEAQVAAATELTAVQSKMSGMSEAYGSGGYARLREQQAKLIETQEILRAESARLNDQLIIAENTMSKVAITEQQLIATETAHAERIAILTERVNTTNAALDLNTIKMNENALAMKRLPLEQLGARAKYVEHLGRTFQTLGLFAGAAVGIAAHAAAKFQTGGALAGTQLVNAGNSSPQNISRLGARVNQGLLGIMASGQSVASADELQQAAYNIPSGIPSLRGSSNQKVRETIALIREFNQVAKANYGLVDLNGVTQAGIILINTFGTSLGHLPREFDVMQSAVNRGKLTMGEFVSGLSQTAPAAKAAGYNFDAMAGTLSFLSGKLPQYTRVAVGYARALELFQNPKFEAYMKAHGAAVTDLTGKLLPYNKIIQQILKVDPELAKGGNLINFLKTASGASGFMQARRVLTVSLQDQAGLSRATQAVPANAQGLVNASAQALSQTGAVKWKELTTEIKALVIEIGTGAIPVIQQLAKPLENAVHWFNQLDPATKHQIGQFAAWSAAGLLLVGTFAVIVGALTRFGVAIRLLLLGKAGVAGLEGGFISAGTALRAGLIGALILAIPLMVRYHAQIMRVIGALGGLKTVMTELGIAIGLIKLRSLIGGLALVGTTAATSGTEVGLLRGKLIALSEMSLAPIIIPIALASLIPHSKGGQETLNKLGLGWLGTLPVVGGLYQQAGSLGNKLRTATGGDDLSQPAVKVLSQIQSLQQKIDALEIPPHARGWQKKIADYQAMIKTLENGAAVAGKSANALGSVPFDSGTFSGTNPFPGIVNTKTPNYDLKDAINNVVKLDELAKKTNTVESYKKAAAALAAIQNNTDKDTFAAAQQVISNLETADENHTKKAISEAKKRANALKKIQTDAQKEVLKDAQELQSQYQSMYQANQGAFGQLFNGPFMQGARMQNNMAWGHKITGQDLLHDLKAQVSQFRQWRTALGELRKHGISGQLYEQILAAGPAALPEIHALLSLSKADFRSYARTFNRGQNLIQAATTTDMNQSLLRYKHYGKNVALQMIEGLRSENTPLIKVFEDMILKDFPGLAKKAGGKSASTHSGGASDTNPGAKPPHTGSGHGVTYIYNGKEVDYSTWLRKSKGHHKTFYSHT